MKDLIEFIEEVKSRKKGKLNNLILSELGVQLLQDDIDCCNRMIEMIRKQKKPIKLYEANIKWIEDIIEIVLDNVSCEHQISGEYPRGMRVADVTYSLNDEQEVTKKCFEAIPELPLEFSIKADEKFITKEAKIFIALAETNAPLKIYKDFICSLIKELADKIKFNGGEK